MRKSVVEIGRRAELSQAANNRYLDALATLPTDTPLSRVTAKLCSPLMVEGRRYRGLNPLSPDDARLLEAISRGDWLVAGFRNRDIRRVLFGETDDATTHGKQAARVTRLLGLLRAHRLIKKIPKTHRYLLTKDARSLVPALIAANNTTMQKLTSVA